jgi:precorrin-6B methylase 2
MLPWRSVTIDGQTFTRRFKLIDIDPQAYESATRRFMRRYLHENGHLLVCGGGTGVTALTAAQRIQHVTAVEADPEVIDQMLEHIRINDVENVSVYQGWVGQPTDADKPIDVDAVHLDRFKGVTAAEIDLESNGLKVIDMVPETVKTVFYETHPTMGVDAELALHHLNAAGFDIINRAMEWEKTGGEILVGYRS